jgi:hypothetical protein
VFEMDERSDRPSSSSHLDIFSRFIVMRLIKFLGR